jgi:hypothetical protein
MPPCTTVPGGSIVVPFFKQLPGKEPFACIRVNEAKRASNMEIICIVEEYKCVADLSLALCDGREAA